MAVDDSTTELFVARVFGLKNGNRNCSNYTTTVPVPSVGPNDADYSNSTMRVRCQKKRQALDKLFTIRIPPLKSQKENSRSKEIQRILKYQKNGRLQLGFDNETYTRQELSLLCRAFVGTLKLSSHQPLQSFNTLHHLRQLSIGWTIPQSWLSRLASLISTSGGDGVFTRLDSFTLVNQTGLQWYTLRLLLQQLSSVRHLEFQRVRLLPSTCGSDGNCSITNVLKYLPRRRQLSTLNLIQCGIQDRDCSVLCELLQSRRRLLSDKDECVSLSLRGNNRLTRGVGVSISELMKTLLQPGLSSLQRLDLTECGISTNAVSHITDALMMTSASSLSSSAQSSSALNCKRRELILARNYRIGKAANSDNTLLKRFFTASCKTLRLLDLSFCNLSNDDVAWVLEECLTDPGCQIKGLVLKGCNRDVRGSLSSHAELWNMLEVNTSLSSLAIKTEGSSTNRLSGYKCIENDVDGSLLVQSQIHDVFTKNYQLQTLEIDDFSLCTKTKSLYKRAVREADSKHDCTAFVSEFATQISFWLQLNRSGRHFLRLPNHHRCAPHQQHSMLQDNVSTDTGITMTRQQRDYHRHYRLESHCWSHLLANTGNVTTTTTPGSQADILFWLLRNGGMEQIVGSNR